MDGPQAIKTGITTAPDSERADLPKRIGDYRIMGVLGEGGMGIVYLAEQVEPIRRTVALKLIKTNLDRRGILGRFETERQALAMMNHPNIAAVLDAGATETGLPYFVMEYVSGEPITSFCDRESLTVRQRVALFVDVCNAIHHAHQKAVIHRDVKPTNILVGMVDDKPVAKVIDFGVAKATSQRLTEQTVYTEVGQLIGTPEYMSPEQAEMSPLDVDTRTDVYALGVVLYELLTGTLPFESRRLRARSYPEIQRIIREVVPPRPSVRLRPGSRLTRVSNATASTVASGTGSIRKSKASTPDSWALAELAAESTTGISTVDVSQAAQVRGTHAKSLLKQVRGDLDCIVMKCLEKNRARRYASAKELADDCERFLRHTPLVARPPNVTEHALMWLHRHRLLLAGLLFMLVLTAMATYSAISAASALRTLNAQREKQELAKAIPGLLAQADYLAREKRGSDARAVLRELIGIIRTHALPLWTDEDRALESLAQSHAADNEWGPAQAALDELIALRKRDLTAEWSIRYWKFDRAKERVLEPNVWAALTGAAPLTVGKANECRIEWAEAPPVPSLPREGFVSVAEARFALAGGRYQIRAEYHDGIRLFVDDTLWIDDFRWHSAAVSAGVEVELPRGEHAVRVEHVNFGAPMQLAVAIRAPQAESARSSDGANGTSHLADAMLALADLLLESETPKPVDSVAHAAQAVSILRAQRGDSDVETVRSTLVLARAQLAATRIDEAARLLTEARQLAERGGAALEPEALRAKIGLARVDCARGRGGDAIAVFESTHARPEYAGVPLPERIDGLVDWGGALIARREFAAAAERLQEAIAALESPSLPAAPPRRLRRSAFAAMEKLFEAWHVASPQDGHDRSAKEWRDRLAGLGPPPK